jgi:hypothetical protein
MQLLSLQNGCSETLKYKMRTLKSITLLIGIICCASCQSKWKPYRPLVFTNHPGLFEGSLREDMKLYSKVHRCRIKQVFDYNGIPWKEEKGEILISTNLSDEYIWNMTLQATGELPAMTWTTYDSTGAVVKHDTLIFRCDDAP